VSLLLPITYQLIIINNGFVISPDAALRGIVSRCGVRPSTRRSSRLARLACETFYAAVVFGSFSTFCEFVINDEKDEVEPLRIMSSFHGKRIVLMVKKSLTNGAKQTISILPFYGGCRTDPAIKKHNKEGVCSP
jgi:hypothetical protein